MTSPANIAKHPIHPMLVAFPSALLVFSLVSDLIHLFGWGEAVWNDVAYYTMAGGIIGALVAAVPGLIDLLAQTEAKVKKIGVTHMIINLVAVAIFAINFWLRTKGTTGAAWPIALSVIGVALLCVSGWLGGEMVYVHGVAVAPPSETGRTEPVKKEEVGAAMRRLN
ncbi:MAG TPA: DUF2231 domain-containing protein [Pyrinomonadaceae bacterium]|nr:DUF2231 domain-containing protein [Pyrinomonadaceae bacterium]